MIRSAFLALVAAAILVVALGWQNIASPGWGQFSIGWGQLAIDWDQLAEYYNQETVEFRGVISDEGQIKPLISKMKAANIALMNSSYPETLTDTARLTIANRECVSPKANLAKTAVFLRSTLSEPLDPLGAFYDRNAALPPELTLFFQDYGYGSHTLTTNDLGERVTVPALERPRKVIVAGGSVAFGTLLDDANALGSQLQARDSEHQYITLALPDGPAEQIICNLTKAIPPYRGQVDELLYLYSEADFSEETFGTPEEVISALKNLALTETIPKITVIYSPTIYNLVPHYTRYRGYVSDRIPNRDNEKERLRRIVAGAGYGWLDMGELVLTAGKAQGSEFAVLNNFADDRNLSPQGITLLADKLRGPLPPPVSAEPVSAAATQETAAARIDPGLEKRLQKQTEALDDIRAAAGRAAKNNRLKNEVGRILQRLKEELASGQ
jgi:hypothetical protein